MKRSINIYILFSIIFLLSSCNRRTIVNKATGNFNENYSEHYLIKDYLYSNDVLSVFIDSENEVTFKTVTSVEETVFPIQISDSISFIKYIQDTTTFMKVVCIMKENKYIAIYRNKEGVDITLDNSFPCCKICFNEFGIDSVLWIQELIASYEDLNKKQWAYRLDDYWYIIRIPCLN